MLPHTIFEETFIEWIYPLGNIIGLNLLNPNYRVSVNTIVTGILMLAMILLAWSQMLVADRMNRLWLFGESISATQGCIKVVFFILNRQTLIEQRGVLEALYLQNNIINPDYDHVTFCATNTYRMIKFFSFLYASNGCILIFWPAADYFLTGELHPIFTPQMIGTDLSTPMGYTITLMFHISLTISLVLWFIYFDGLYAIYVFNVWLFSGLICHQIEQLNGVLEDEEATKDILRIKITFRNILKMHAEMAEYVTNVNDSFKSASFLILMIASSQMILSIYLAIFMAVTQHYFFLACYIGQTFMICSLGTVVELANDSFDLALTDLKWYPLPNAVVKNYPFLVAKTQNPTILNAGGLRTMPLNVSTFVQILRKIYTFAAMLYQFVD